MEEPPDPYELALERIELCQLLLADVVPPDTAARDAALETWGEW